MSDTDPSSLYGPEFFAEMAEGRERLRLLAECIWRVVGPAQNVIDIGCGTGAVIEWMQEHGASVWGLDMYGTSDVVRIIRTDIARPEVAIKPMQLVICTETAEHLPESAADTLVKTCVAYAVDHIVWSAAPPGQDGVGHINCQPPEYWLDKFGRMGWQDDAPKSVSLRTMMRELHAQHEHCADNFYVLTRVAETP